MTDDASNAKNFTKTVSEWQTGCSVPETYTVTLSSILHQADWQQRALAKLKSFEWRCSDGIRRWCPDVKCGRDSKDDRGHSEDCELAKLIREGEGV